MKNCLALVALIVLAASATAADPPPLLAAQGAIEKVDVRTGTLTVKSRGADGKFGKNLVLKITGTSKVTTLTPRLQKGNVVVAQKDTEVKELLPKQAIALVYTMLKDSPILLAAVVQPPDAK